MPQSPIISPQGRNRNPLSSFAESIIIATIGPTNKSNTNINTNTTITRSESYGRVAADEDLEQQQQHQHQQQQQQQAQKASLPEESSLASPPRTDDRGNDDAQSIHPTEMEHTTDNLPFLRQDQHRGHGIGLVSVPPSNYLCPLTLQLMEDPVHDSCGHTFERRAILEYLALYKHNEAVCPISRKPMAPLGDGSSNSSNSSCSNKGTGGGYGRVLIRNEGLQQRIQEWKLEHPLYQGVDARYADRQRVEMLTHAPMHTAPIHSNSNSNISNHRSNINIHKQPSMECPYGDESIDCSTSTSTSTSHSSESKLFSKILLDTKSQHRHPLSRFERMFLPQEREILVTLQKQASEERKRLDWSRSCRCRCSCLLVGVAVTMLLWIGAFYAYYAFVDRT